MSLLGDAANWVGGAADSIFGAATGRVDYQPREQRVDTRRINPSSKHSAGLQNDLALAASGQGGPSAAEAQLNAGTQAGLRQQLAMAASARGGAAQQAAARRQGMQNAAMQQGQASNEAAALRAREQQAAQAALSNLSIGQQQVDLGIEQANMNALTANQGQRMAAAQQSASGKQTAIGGLMQAGGALAMMSDVRGKEDIRPMTGYEQAGAVRGMPVYQAPQAGAYGGVYQAPPTAPAAAPAQGGGAGFGAALSAMGGALSDANSKEEIRSLRAQLDAVTRGAEGMRAAPVAYPEPRAIPEDLRRLATPEGSREGLGAVEPYQYRYRPDAAAQYGEDTAPRAGVMAQELQQSPYLASAVVPQPDGRLAIDGSRGLSASLAAAAGLDKRLRALEVQYPTPQPPPRY